jgi:hypothetical protein
VISPLNPIRFILIAIIPLIIYLISIFVRYKNKLVLVDLNSLSQRFEIFYIVLATCLIVLHSCDLTKTTGEAVVRFFTLLSFPALLALVSSGGLSRALVSAYILAINACFFLATLNMWPGFVLEFMRLLGKS